MSQKFRIFKTGQFDNDFEALEKNDKQRVENFLRQLSEKGSAVGKPLSGLKFFREKKIRRKKALLFDLWKLLCCAGCGNKRQESTASHNKRNFDSSCGLSAVCFWNITKKRSYLGVPFGNVAFFYVFEASFYFAHQFLVNFRFFDQRVIFLFRNDYCFHNSIPLQEIYKTIFSTCWLFAHFWGKSGILWKEIQY